MQIARQIQTQIQIQHLYNYLHFLQYFPFQTLKIIKLITLSHILLFETMCTLQVCKSDPNPILSDSFGFRNKNIYFGLDRIDKVVS
jgi:hypothetical protein